MTDESDIEYNSPDEIALYVEEQLARLGIDGAFRGLDATASDDDTITVGDHTIETHRYDFELPFEPDDNPDELGEELTWKTNGLVHELGRVAFEAIEDETTWADDVPSAIDAVDGQTALILGNTNGGWIGRLDRTVSIWTDSVSLPVDTALVVDTDRYGYRTTTQPVEVLEYHDEEHGMDIVKVRLRRGYTVMNPDTGRLVDISGP